MARHPVIVDTNVVVAGLLTANDTSPVALVLDGVLTARFSFVVSQALLGEYHAVLLRPKLHKLHRLTADEVDTFLTDLAQHAIVLNAAPEIGQRAPDPGDQFLWDLLAARADLQLITGDTVLLKDVNMRGRVISPRQFLNAA